MTPLFVSFFTPAYAAEAAGLVESLNALGLPHDVRAVQSTGEWVKNCGRKAAFLREMRAEHPGRPLVWLDADARVRQPPTLFGMLGAFDFAAHWRLGAELLSGTLYFNYTDAAGELLTAWAQETRFFPGIWDQKTLDVAKDRVPGLRIFRLPAPYTCVFDDPKMGPPVIEHLQASRRLSKAVQ